MNRFLVLLIILCLCTGCSSPVIEYTDPENYFVIPGNASKSEASNRPEVVNMPEKDDYRHIFRLKFNPKNKELFGFCLFIATPEWDRYKGFRFEMRTDHYPVRFRFRCDVNAVNETRNYTLNHFLELSDDKWNRFEIPFSDFGDDAVRRNYPLTSLDPENARDVTVSFLRDGDNRTNSTIEITSIKVFRVSPRFQFW